MDGFLGRREPCQLSLEAEDSSWDGPGATSAELKGGLADFPLIPLTPLGDKYIPLECSFAPLDTFTLERSSI